MFEGKAGAYLSVAHFRCLVILIVNSCNVHVLYKMTVITVINLIYSLTIKFKKISNRLGWQGYRKTSELAYFRQLVMFGR